MRLGDGLATFSGDPKRNESYFLFGAEVVAAAPGRIVATRDDVPENTPPGTRPGIGPNDLAGNFVNQDLGGGRFALYGHMQPGSLRVKPGDQVVAGQVLGLVGNTGNSSEPHLHFQVMDSRGGPSNLGAEGLPYVFDAFRLEGRVAGLAADPPAPRRAPARPPADRTAQYPFTGTWSRSPEPIDSTTPFVEAAFPGPPPAGNPGIPIGVGADGDATSAGQCRYMVFENRRDAGRWLSDLLRPMAAERPIVIALPRGGVPVAVEVARALDAPLDLLMVRKLGAPQDPELGIGAVAEDGTAVVDTALARRVGLTQEDFDRILGVELRELRRRMERFRDGRPPIDVRGRTVILVDDGLATGLSDLAAVRALRERGAGRIVVAVPVGSRDAVAMLRRAADEVVCHTIPADLIGVGRWYRDFAQVTDDEVLALLAQAGVPTPPPAADPPEEPAGQVVIDLGGVRLYGDLALPPGAHGLVIFAHGSGSSRLSPRNRMVARRLEDAGLATLLFDLLAGQEEGRRDLVFDIPLLAGRLEAVTRWAQRSPSSRGLPIGYFGASTGAAAALRAAAALGDDVERDRVAWGTARPRRRRAPRSARGDPPPGRLPRPRGAEAEPPGRRDAPLSASRPRGPGRGTPVRGARDPRGRRRARRRLVHGPPARGSPPDERDGGLSGGDLARRVPA